MKVWTSNDWKGVWPVGTALVVVAETEEEARKLVSWEITGDFTLEEVSTKFAHVTILCDGDY